MPAMHAYMDDFGKVTIWMKRNFYQGRSDYFYLTSDKGVYIDMLVTRVEEHPDAVRYDLTTPADLPFGTEYRVHESHGLCVPLEIRLITQKQAFSEMFYYEGDDLGSIYSPEETSFAVWAPTASRVLVRITKDSKTYCFDMKRGNQGVYRTKVAGDLQDATYTYLVTRNGETIEACDPYALSSTENGKSSAVINLERIPSHSYPLQTEIHSNVDAVIYECSIRDMTSGRNSGTSTHGLFSSLSEPSTMWKGQPTGLNYLTKLGVTHVQFMPVLDFVTVDELHPDRGYNWGYDPNHYLCLEGSYSSDPKDPYARMIEFRHLVDVLHQNDIRVNLDVVFNHVYDVEQNALNRIVPYYYFRYNASGYLSNGSYCGNDLSSKQPMTRKYFLDVTRKLMEIYDIDGYRFDLMGILDVETMNQLNTSLRKIKPDVMLYGEGWDMPTDLPSEEKACIVNQNKMPDIGHFNDFYRDVAKGKTSDDQKYEKGYLTGDLNQAFSMCSALVGNVLGDPYFYRFDSPCKTINGVETHDNATAWDKMRACCSTENHEIRLQRAKLLIGATLFAQGIPFLHAGQEYCGTKNNNSNSYNAGDAINQMDWDRAVLNLDTVEYTRKAIAIRKQYKGFRYATSEEVKAHVHAELVESNLVMYELYAEGEHLRIFFNPTYDGHTFYYGESYQVVFDESGNPREHAGQEIYVPGLSIIVAKQI